MTYPRFFIEASKPHERNELNLVIEMSEMHRTLINLNSDHLADIRDLIDKEIGERAATPVKLGDGLVHCSFEGCPETVKDNRWARVKAEDWFFQKDGNSWCPRHTPEWVEAWRAKR